MTDLKKLTKTFGNANLTGHEAAARVIKYFLHVRLVLATEFLGTKALDPEVFTAYVLSKAPEGARAGELHLAEKTLSIIAKETFGKERFDKLSDKEKEQAVEAAKKELAGTSVFHRDAAGNIVIWDYQVRGHLKAMADSFRAAQREEKKAGRKPRVFGLDWPAAGKKKIDLSVFVFPRIIPLSVHETGICERPLRAEVFDSKLGYPVERVSLARSETVPPGTSMEFIIGISESSPYSLEHIAAMMDYGYCHGYGQWRNSGKGAFTWNCLGIYEDLSEAEAAELIQR